MATPAPPPSHYHRHALQVALLYALFAALWITLSDALLAWWLPDGALRARIGTLKGWLFVGVTSVLLYTVLYRWAATAAQDAPMADDVPERIVPRWSVAALVGTIVGLTVFVLGQRYDQAEQAAQRFLVAAAHGKATQLVDWHRERQEDVWLAAQTRVIRDGWDRWFATLAAVDNAELRRRLAVLLSTRRYSHAGLLDAHGHTLWQPDPGDRLPLDPRLQTLARAALETDRPQFGSWRDGDGQWQWWYAAAVAGAAHPVALLLRVADAERLEPMRLEMRDRTTGETYTLVRREGGYAQFLDVERVIDQPTRVPLDDSDHPAVRWLRADPSPAASVQSGRDRQGVAVVAAGHPVGDTGWWAVALLPRERVWQEALRGAEATLLAALLAIFATGVGVRLFVQRLQLQQIRAHAEQLQALQTQLADSEARYRLLAEHAADVVWLYDLAQARFLYVSPSVERLLGRPAETLVGHGFDGLLPPASLAYVHKRLSQRVTEWARGERAALTETTELDLCHADGHAVPTETVSTLVTDERGQAYQLQGVTRDLSARRAAEAKAYQLAWFDPLTGLPNRARALDALERALRDDLQRQGWRAVLLLNLDRFKTLNDALGHASGDTLLQLLAQRLQAAIGAKNLLARLGSDEFACLPLESAPDPVRASHAGQALADALLAALTAPFTVDQTAAGEVNVTASVGIAIMPQSPQDTPLDVLRRADTALRRAKELGGRRSVFFDASMGAHVARRFAIEQDLRRALAANELRLYLQPQVDASGHCQSAEALVRWQHPVRGLIAPAEFVPVAEGCDLIEPLGAWVLQATCAHLGRLARMGQRLTIAVNVSPRQFHRPQFVEEVLAALTTHGARARDLVLEVTESVVVEDVAAVVERMKALTQHGIRFSLDDFGTGYSSLSYLKQLPIQELKIDRSFVRDAPSDPDDAALVEAIIAVAQRLHLQVVAEGVETAEEAAFFARWPQVRQQGYLHGRPEAAETVLARWLASTGAAGTGGMR